MEGGNGHCGISRSAQAFYDVRRGHTDTVNGTALTGDDLSAGLSYVVLYVLAVILVRNVIRRCDRLIKLVKRNARDGSGGPSNEGCISVLTENVCVYLLLVYVVDLCKTGTKTDGVKHGTGSEHLVLRKTGKLEERVGKDIYGVCNDNVDSVGSNLNYLVCDSLKYADIGLNELKS